MAKIADKEHIKTDKTNRSDNRPELYAVSSINIPKEDLDENGKIKRSLILFCPVKIDARMGSGKDEKERRDLQKTARR